MYCTCLFCAQSLGRNEVVEHFPVGRRLAFDAARGRLWAVCPSCERWNLTPLEERWEAIEQCERLFRDTRLRQSTDNVGLARLREGLELVRIGAPQRPELAAWRYGDQFGHRHRKRLLVLGGMGLAAAGLAVAGPVIGLGVGVVAPAIWMYNTYGVVQFVRARRALRVPLDDGQTTGMKRTELGEAMLMSVAGASGGDWQLHISRTQLVTPLSAWRTELVKPPLVLTGAAAIRAAGVILPGVNRGGGGRNVVQDAVGLLEETRSPDALFDRIAMAGPDRVHLFPLPLGPSLPLPPGAHGEAQPDSAGHAPGARDVGPRGTGAPRARRRAGRLGARVAGRRGDRRHR